jgi:sugar lactone lactonase YvrE
MSPDGRFVAVTVMNGSNKPKDSPFVSDHGLVRIYRLSGKDLTHLTDDKVGHWCQGAAWSKNGRTLLVQCMVEKEIYDFEFDGNGMKKRSTIRVNGGPAGIRTAEP